MTLYTCDLCWSVSVLYSISYIEVNLITRRKNYLCENCWRGKEMNGSVHLCGCWNREKKHSCEICEVEFSSSGMHSHSRNYENWHACFKCLICDVSAPISPCRCVFPVYPNHFLNYSFSQNIKQICDLPEQRMVNIDESTSVNNCSLTSEYKLSFRRILDKTKSTEIIYVCNECNKDFNSKEDLINHQRTLTSENPSESSRSENSFLTGIHLKCRESHHDEKSYICYTGNKEIKYHFKTRCAIHTDKNSYICEVCNKRFTSCYNLKIHRIVHRDGKLFTCDVCNRCFTTSLNLSTHRVRHTTLTPYICDVCKKHFIRKVHLETHCMIHTGEKPFMCDVCNKSCNRLL